MSTITAAVVDEPSPVSNEIFDRIEIYRTAIQQIYPLSYCRQMFSDDE